MPEEEEKFRCPHGERNQALMLCSLDCDLSGAHPDRKAKADGRFIITSWWCLHKCRWTGEAINLAEAGNLAQEHERLVSRRVTRKRAEKNLARDLT